MTLRLFITYDSDLDRYILMCADGRMGPMPAGQRLFRAAPHPDIEFNHATMEAAEDAADKLRVYLSALAPRKISKKEAREYVA